VASFLKSSQLSALSLQLPTPGRPTTSARCQTGTSFQYPTRADGRRLSIHYSPFSCLPSAFCLLLTAFHGGFVPVHANGHSFVIKQIGGFVF